MGCEGCSYTFESNMYSSTACGGFDSASVDFLKIASPPSAVAHYSYAEILDLHLIPQGVCLIKT